MPRPRISREEVLDRLLETFRANGYDGASLAELSSATGLGRSSLYHYFPNGKEDMALQVMDRLSQALEINLLAPLRGPGPPEARLQAMIAVLRTFYDEGRKACLLERLCASVDRGRFGSPLAGVFAAWIAAVEVLCIDAGVSAVEARDRAEDAVTRVEGALVLAVGQGDPEVFGRALARVQRTLLVPDGAPAASTPASSGGRTHR